MICSDSMRGRGKMNRVCESFLTFFISLLLLFTFNGRQSSKQKKISDLTLLLKKKKTNKQCLLFRCRLRKQRERFRQLGHVHGHGGHVAHDDLVLGQHGVGQHPYLLFSFHVGIRHQQRPHLGQRSVQEFGQRSLHHQYVAERLEANNNSENKHRTNNRRVLQVQSEMFNIVHTVRIRLPVRREQCECDGRLGVDERCHHDQCICDKF